MLSGNGRHRRPRQAPALLVAAGVTGSAIAIPLLGASGASAATGTTWDRVAECESGGSWSENSGNGYYGGLQLSQEDWEKYGGLAYAETADLASRSQQIAVAEKILDDQGVGAFSTCGLLSGLTKDSDSLDIDTGVGDDSSGSSASSGSSDSGDISDSSGLSDSSEQSSGADSPGGDASGSGASREVSSGTPSASASGDSSRTGDSSPKSDTSPTPSAPASGSGSGSGSSGAQESESSPTASANGDESDNYQQDPGTSHLVDTGSLAADTAPGTGRHRGDSAEETPLSYTVREGDSLCSIADSLDLDGGWRRLYAENKQAIGSDPSRIAAGQTLDLPAESGEKQR